MSLRYHFLSFGDKIINNTTTLLVFACRTIYTLYDLVIYINNILHTTSIQYVKKHLLVLLMGGGGSGRNKHVII